MSRKVCVIGAGASGLVTVKALSAEGVALDCIAFPFFAPSVLAAPDNQVALYHRVVHPDLPGLSFVGLVQVIGSLLPVAELQARWVAGLLSGRLGLPDRATMLRVIAEDQRALRRRFTDSSRHTIEVDYWPYLHTLRQALRGELDRPSGATA